MAKREKPKEEVELEMDLTPMIDIVFQLIIFFMLVSEMTTADLAQLSLPEARNAVKPEGSKKVLTINIQKTGKRGTIVIRGKKFQPKQDFDKFRRFLGIEAKAAGLVANPAASNRISELKVLIRSDRDAEFGIVQDVFEACSKEKIWKVAVGATEPAAKN